MGKKFKKLLSLALSLAILATFCVVPMTASAAVSADETYEDYDVIGYSDLKDTGDNYLTPGGIALPANDNSYSYAATSSTHSAIFKVRVTVANDLRFQIHFSSYSSSNNFAYRLDGGNWQHRGSGETVSAGAIKAGDTFDIETARLKVKTGPNAGKYYTYFIVNGTTIFEKYVDADSSNTTGFLGDYIYFNQKAFETEPCTISPFVEIAEETFEAYDEIGYEDLLVDGNPVEAETALGSKTFTYNQTSPSGSVVFNYCWMPTAGAESFLSFDTLDDGGWAYMFGVQIITPTDAYPNGSINLRPGYDGGEVELPSALETGKAYNIEFARKKVATGPNAGKYYVYFKMDGTILADEYVDAGIGEDGKYTSNWNNLSCTLSNKIYINNWGGSGGHKITQTQEPETFEAYDEIGYEDLLVDGNPVEAETELGSKTFTYNQTSPSGSVVFNYCWMPTAGAESFLSFDTLDDGGWAYMFGVQIITPTDAYPNGSINLRPGYDGGEVELPSALETGKAYNIEFARKKVATGPNAGKYYVYFKMDGTILAGEYVDAGIGEDGKYTSNWNNLSCTLSNKIYINNWGGSGGHKITQTQVPETYETPTEIGLTDLKDGDAYLSGEKTMGSGSKVFTFDADTYSNVVKLTWKAGVTSTSDFKFSFDTRGTDGATNSFGFGVRASSEASAIDTLVFRNELESNVVELAKPIEKDDEHSIELGRKKVLTGENTGKYYVYLKFDGELIGEEYVTVDANNQYDDSYFTGTLSHSIRIVTYGRGGADIIKEFSVIEPEPEDPEVDTDPDSPYYAYDEIYYTDLVDENGAALGTETTISGHKVFKYNQTSPTGSAIFRYRWTAGSQAKFQLSFDRSGTSTISYMFGAWMYAPGEEADAPNGRLWMRPSYGPINKFSESIAPYSTHDIEYARLKIKNGDSAGQYWVYLKIDGEMIAQDYVAADVVDSNGNYTSNGSTVFAISNEILITCWGSEGTKISASPIIEEYETYDEIGYEDLKDENGEALGSQKLISNDSAVLTYDSTSPTGSVIFKYRWKIGSQAKFQLSFEKSASNAMEYMFGAWMYAPGEEASAPNGRIWLRPSYGPTVNFDESFVSGTTHNVEFARLKIKNGPNAGKYWLYLKIDGEMIAQDYIAADVVDSEGNYTTNPGGTTCNVKSGEILFTFWSSDNNVLSPYKELGSNDHEGTSGDFDGDGVINGTDLTVLRKILLGTQDTSEMPEGIADFNNDGDVDVRDLVAVKKYLAPVNTYSKVGSLALGMQEHLLEDSTKTVEYIADASATMGASVYRLSMPIHSLYYVTDSNGVAVKEENMAKFKSMVAALKAKGINEILYVTDSFILPYGYSDPEKNHNKTVPDSVTDPDNYAAWLTVNAAAFKALAEEVPEIKYFEPYNEPNVEGNRLETYGIGWDASEEEQAAHKFTMAERAAIMADLCWYISQAVKSVDSANQVTTPSLSVDTNHDIVEGDFLDALYDAIESGAYPTNKAVADKRIDNYFTIINIHSYPQYTNYSTESQAQTQVDEWANRIQAAYNVVKAHNDGNSRVWITETGMSTTEPSGDLRNKDKVANIITKALEKLDSDLTFVDTAIFYKLADVSSDNGASYVETSYGLFYSGDDFDYPYEAKPTAKAIYSFFNNGSTDYSALEELVGRYAE